MIAKFLNSIFLMIFILPTDSYASTTKNNFLKKGTYCGSGFSGVSYNTTRINFKQTVVINKNSMFMESKFEDGSVKSGTYTFDFYTKKNFKLLLDGSKMGAGSCVDEKCTIAMDNFLGVLIFHFQESSIEKLYSNSNSDGIGYSTWKVKKTASSCI